MPEYLFTGAKIQKKAYGFYNYVQRKVNRKPANTLLPWLGAYT